MLALLLADTFNAVEDFADFCLNHRELQESTVGARDRYLQRLFSAAVIDDEAVGRRRPPTLAESMAPGKGRALVRVIRAELEKDLPAFVVYDLLHALRTFLRHIAKNTFLLNTGTDLDGMPAACPIEDREIKKRPRKSPIGLPDVDRTNEIIDFVTHDWARG